MVRTLAGLDTDLNILIGSCLLELGAVHPVTEGVNDSDLKEMSVSQERERGPRDVREVSGSCQSRVFPSTNYTNNPCVIHCRSRGTGN